MPLARAPALMRWIHSDRKSPLRARRSRWGWSAGSLHRCGLCRPVRLLLAMGSHHHDHVAAVLARLELDVAELLDVLREALQQPEPQLGAGLLASAEHDRDLDFVARLEEPHDVTLLGLVVVRIDLRPELHLLDDRVHLVAARFTGLLRGLVLELAVVHELADRWPGGRR